MRKDEIKLTHIYYLVLVSAIAGGDYKAQQIDSYMIPSQCVVAVDARSMYLEDEQALVCIRKVRKVSYNEE